MRKIYKNFLHLLILNIYIGNIYSYGYLKSLYNDDDSNEVQHENIDRRVRAVNINEDTTFYDRSENVTFQSSAYTVPVSITNQSIFIITQMIDQSATDLTTEETSPLIATNSTMPVTTDTSAEMSITNTITTTINITARVTITTTPTTTTSTSTSTTSTSTTITSTSTSTTSTSTSTTSTSTSTTSTSTTITSTSTSTTSTSTSTTSTSTSTTSTSTTITSTSTSTTSTSTSTTSTSTSTTSTSTSTTSTSTTITSTSTSTTSTSTSTTSTSTSTTSTSTTITSTSTSTTSTSTSTTSTSTSTTSTSTTITSTSTSTTSTSISTTSTSTSMTSTSTTITSTSTSTTSTSTSTTSTSTSTTSTSTKITSTSTSTTSTTSTSTSTTSTSTTITTNSTSTTNNSLTTTVTTTIIPSSCNFSTEVQLSNGTCVSKSDGQISSVDTLRSNSSNSTAIANALSLYISSITNSNTSLNSTYTLTVNEIDTYLTNISNVNITINTTNSILISQQPNQGENIYVLGASFTRDIGGEVVKTSNEDNVINSSLSVAAVVNNQSLTDVTSLNMLIIDKPSSYTNIDNSTNKTLASSVIVASVQRNSSSSTFMNVSLFFQILPEYQPNVSATYLCSFYDTHSYTWNESGCTSPYYNQQFNRYECSCDHLTSFALIWLPQSLSINGTQTLDAQDIASLVFQSISIISFILIIIHAFFIRIKNPIMSLRAYDLLPLISSASTTILFIFYIALGMTVYTQTSSSNQTQCFLSSSVLMFFVYFFLIFMFCVKTSIGYFNYLRFVCLFPEPSNRKLFTMLIISFFISITWVSIAAGLNSNSSFTITQLYPYKLCWFTRNVIYYFLTIPACLFLLINIITFILVSIRIINHVRNATSPHQSYERMKRCVVVLLSSCLTQGIGWLFGPFISIVNEEAGNVLGWFFIVFNGLEGFWSIILYIILRSKQMDKPTRVIAAQKLMKSKDLTSDEYKPSFNERYETDKEVERRETDVKYRDREKDASHSFDDLRDLRSINWPVSNEKRTSYL